MFYIIHIIYSKGCSITYQEKKKENKKEKIENKQVATFSNTSAFRWSPCILFFFFFFYWYYFIKNMNLHKRSQSTDCIWHRHFIDLSLFKAKKNKYARVVHFPAKFPTRDLGSVGRLGFRGNDCHLCWSIRTMGVID